jgi:hypothetical protein
VTVPNIQIREVPPDVHRRLKAQAALAGQSMNEFLLARLGELTSTPTVEELIEQIRDRERYSGPSAAALIREDRDSR